MRPCAIDLFAGAGGMSLGFEQAGFDVVAAVEIDPIHAAVHKFNFPDCTVLPESVSGLTGADIRNRAGLGSRSIDLVCGGAPCQGFSMIGKRAIDDPRNALVKDFLRIVRELDARAFVFENVKGLTVGKHRRLLHELIAEFEAAGYDVVAPPRVLNARNFGVPQSRERLFLLGVKKGEQRPSYPAPLPAGPTCHDALADLPEAEDYPELLQSDAAGNVAWGTPGAYARDMRCLSNAAWHFGYMRDWDRSLLTSSIRTDHTAITRRRFAETAPGKVEPISRLFRLAADGLSNTLRAGTDAARGAFTSPRPIHYDRNRCVTVREMARLHGFPDWFRFHQTKWHGARQIGNAVPPPLARAVASAMMNALGRVPVRPAASVALGDPALLRMDMGEAAAFWRVERPAGKRDRKSGDVKRRQTDIEALRLAALAAE
ncbi:MAG: DNA (cytosine-5-)-methyltransferase [Rhodobacteraceae bacterium PARR1]|nr:MAG: DNA (cytosine-5-)-methyltransferase [Rhodobacteraceae bacterium PARR1]